MSKSIDPDTQIWAHARSEPSQFDVLKASFLFAVSSIAMILLNKASILWFPHPSLLLILQNSASIIILWFRGEGTSLEAGIAFQWLPCSMLFCINLFSSLLSLVYISVPTFTVLRNLQPILAVLMDFMVRGERTSLDRVVYLLQIFIGAILYCSHDLQFELRGYLFALVHILSMTLYSILVKLQSDKLNLSAPNMSWYNNILSIPGLGAIMATEQILNSNQEARVSHSAVQCFNNSWCLMVVAASCFGGFFVSICGFQAQKVMSPISWLSLNNMSKIPAIAISYLLFGGYLSFAAAHGMGISLFSAYLYALAGKQRISRRAHLSGLLITCSSVFWLYGNIHKVFSTPTFLIGVLEPTIRKPSILDPATAPAVGIATKAPEKQRSASGVTRQAKSVLVLGSAGVVGSSLVSTLRRHGYHVLEAPHRFSLDLRKIGCLDKFDRERIDFCFFLACDVGGSRYLNSNYQNASYYFNMQIYEAVFPYLVRRKIPFIFSSSQLSSTQTLYGQVKNLGEVMTARSGHGKSIRFWNVYGRERITVKSHVIQDWIFQCLKHGRVESQTDGNELRDFTYVDDMALALMEMMASFARLPNITDPVSGKWYNMKSIARILEEEILPFGNRCEFYFPSVPARFARSIEPKNPWVVKTDFRSAVRGMLPYYMRMVNEPRTWSLRTDLYVSILIGVTDSNAPRAFLQSFCAAAHQNHLDYEILLVSGHSLAAGDILLNASATSMHGLNSLLITSICTRIRLISLTKSSGQVSCFEWNATSAMLGRASWYMCRGSADRVNRSGLEWLNGQRATATVGTLSTLNIGLRASRGKFIMYVSPHVLVTRSLVEWISKQTLDSGKALFGTAVGEGASHAMSCVGEDASFVRGEIYLTNTTVLTIMPKQFLVESKHGFVFPREYDTDESLFRHVRSLKVDWVEFDDKLCLTSHIPREQREDMGGAGA
eukprot:Tamp_00038.p2 GENE.Tamp_00038~~Tamp_00038.p2  ORF type:complete len:945 (+),score=47.25 Tamp_00038:12872-15706(+)